MHVPSSVALGTHGNASFEPNALCGAELAKISLPGTQFKAELVPSRGAPCPHRLCKV